MAKTSVKSVHMETFDTALLTPAFQAVNPQGLAEACFMIRIVNDCDNPITVSYTGGGDDEYLLAHAAFELYAQTNSQPSAQEALIPRGTIIYVTGAPGAGILTLSGYYV